MWQRMRVDLGNVLRLLISSFSTCVLCRCVLGARVPPGLLHQPGAEVDGPQQPGHRGDWAGPSPLSAGPPRLSKPHRHRCAQTRPHRLRSPQPQDRILSGDLSSAVTSVQRWWRDCVNVKATRLCEGYCNRSSSSSKSNLFVVIKLYKSLSRLHPI